MSNMPITLMDDSPPYLDFSITAKRMVKGKGNNVEVFFEDSEIVTITPMGDNKTQVIKEVPDWMSHLEERHHHHMISDDYLNLCKKSYKAWQENREAPINGTPVDQCASLSPAEVEMVKHANIRSIEDLAAINDEGLQAIGMGARKLKEKAKAYVDSIESRSATSERMESLQGDLETANEERDRMADRLEAMEARLASLPVVDASLQPEAISN